ncbi:hypothetical protein CSKR_109753 [Clonorchis sinensis]|uniref:Uncharacterized protein n=1 Tax=Clonorchis sinensis TaxID=79923 RepID=A0A419QDH8_CLOSI|nr:hypothetical protein CSKR_109753 [Clonorchis sinensis]
MKGRTRKNIVESIVAQITGQSCHQQGLSNKGHRPEEYMTSLREANDFVLLSLTAVSAPVPCFAVKSHNHFIANQRVAVELFSELGSGLASVSSPYEETSPVRVIDEADTAAFSSTLRCTTTLWSPRPQKRNVCTKLFKEMNTRETLAGEPWENPTGSPPRHQYRF